MSDCSCCPWLWEEILTLAPLNLLLHPLQILHFLGNDYAVRVLRVYVALSLNRVFQPVHVPFLLRRHGLRTRTVTTPGSYHWQREIVGLSCWVVKVSQVTAVLLGLRDHWLIVHKSVCDVCIRVIPINILHSWHLIILSGYITILLMNTC